MPGPIAPRVLPHNQPQPAQHENMLQRAYHRVTDGGKQMVNNALSLLAPATGAVHKAVADHWQDKVARLDSKGDTAISSSTLEGKGDVSALLLLTRGGSAGKGGAAAGAGGKAGKGGVSGDVAISAKGQVAHQVKVTRDSDAPDSTYTVSYTKTTAGALGLEGALKGEFKGAFGGKMPLGLEAKLKGEGGAKVANTVEMKFGSPQEAAHAAALIDKLQSADVIDDTARGAALAGKLHPLTGPLAALGGLAAPIEGSANNLMNGLSEQGQVNPGLLKAAGLTGADMKFLQQHITAQEFSVGHTDRGALEGKVEGDLTGGAKRLGQKAGLPAAMTERLDKLKLGAGAEARLDREETVTRRVDYPSATQAGRITDRIDVTDRVSAKLRKAQEKTQGTALPGAGKPLLQPSRDGIYDLGGIKTSISRSTAVAPGTVVDAGVLARANTAGKEPISVTQTTQMPQVSDLLKPDALMHERRDLQQTTITYDVPAAKGAQLLATTAAGSTPLGAGPMLALAGEGFRHDAVQLVGGREIGRKVELVRRDGDNKQTGLKLGLDGVGGVEGSITRNSGVDDYAKAAPAPAKTRPATPPRLVPQHIQVQPYVGVNIRQGASLAAGKVGVAQMGSFIDATGEKKRDAGGHEWLKVKGRDQTDRVVEGWARADNIRPYDARKGDNDASGRMNPSRAGQRAVTVREGDNLWTIAKREHVSHAAVLKANPHLLDRSVIFAGDKVYLPAGR